MNDMPKKRQVGCWICGEHFTAIYKDPLIEGEYYVGCRRHDIKPGMTRKILNTSAKISLRR